MASIDAADRHVFLSYARADREKVDQILHALRVRGFPVFIDQDMVSGVEWETGYCETSRSPSRFA